MVRDGWRETRIGDLCEGVFDGPHATPKKTESGPVFLGISCLSKGRIDLSIAEHLSEEDFGTWTRRITPRPGDVVFSYETRIGEAALIPPGLRCCLGRRMALMRPDISKTHPLFLLYSFMSPEFQRILASRTIHGSTVDRIPLMEFPGFPMSVPSLGEQVEIARILGALDDKIDVNRRMNETLEALARLIFRSWFVDFDPVRAKAEGRPPHGMDAKTACLFPDSIKASPIGDKPAGWKVETLADHVEAVKGLSYKGSGLGGGGLPLHNLNSVFEGGGYKHAGIKYYSGEYKERHVVRSGDVIVTNTEQGFGFLLIGYPAIVPKRYGDFGLFSHHVFRVRPLAGSPLTPNYIYHALFDPRIRDEVIGCTNGTTVNMLPADGLKRPRLVVPPGPIVAAFDRIVAPMLEKIEANDEEARTLAALRDALLPKLLSGEIRVDQAESLVQ